jgi:hypothetical protein
MSHLYRNGYNPVIDSTKISPFNNNPSKDSQTKLFNNNPSKDSQTKSSITNLQKIVRHCCTE